MKSFTENKLPVWGLAAAAGAGLVTLVSVYQGIPDATAGITATKHNLTSASGTGNRTNGTDQVCVFCHTPHGSNTSVVVPLWNKDLPASNTFTTYEALGTSTLDGEVLSVGSVSIACLSCHDGSQAMDNMLNAPGSGGYDATGGGTGGLGYTWTAGAAGNIDTATGKLTGTPIPMLGKDLRNDHPIGIEYCGGGLSGAAGAMGGTCKDGDFVDGTNTPFFTGGAVKTKDVNSKPVFWVETGNDANRNKTDIILYSRTFTAGADRPSVECASCHDPHVESKGTDNIAFMRVTTAGSAICLACHVK